ncbi:MAG: hypothetical protein JWO31_26 [Phycisphaerales bacterium]|nr:hypothetical protein [Phycisphaerales bacterium]
MTRTIEAGERATAAPCATAVLTAGVDELVAGSLEAFAFVLAGPAELPASPPAGADLLYCGLPFAGAVSGRLELVFPTALAAVLAANLLCVDPGDPAAADGQADAARELMNVTGGALLARLGEAELSGTTMGLPTVRPATPADWRAVAADPRAGALDAEGHVVVARVVVGA